MCNYRQPAGMFQYRFNLKYMSTCILCLFVHFHCFIDFGNVNIIFTLPVTNETYYTRTIARPVYVLIYTVGHKKRDTFIFVITLANVKLSFYGKRGNSIMAWTRTCFGWRSLIPPHNTSSCLWNSFPLNNHRFTAENQSWVTNLSLLFKRNIQNVLKRALAYLRAYIAYKRTFINTLCLKNDPTLKRYSSKFYWSILMIFGRWSIQKTLE